MNQNSSKKAKANGKPRQNHRNTGSGIDPPQFALQPVFNRRLRFVNAAASTIEEALKSIDMLSALGAIAMGDGNAYAICASFRLKSIEIWATPKSDSDGAWQSAYVEWHNSTSFAKSTKVADASNSNARPLHIFAKPPKDSVCNFWIQGDAVEYLTIKVPTGAIIDFNVQFTMCDLTESRLVLDSDVHPAGSVLYGSVDRSSLSQLVQIDRQS